METQQIDETTELYLGHWRRLVSTTNWDKGRIICEWRQSRLEAGASAAEASDEAWSREVGNVTGQHVGRLRRTWERFAESRDDYRGLFWSHFQAASDWDDAEMWLEGAVQNDWSVMDMRRQRAATLGLDDAESGESLAAETATAEPLDDDADLAVDAPAHAHETAVYDPSATEASDAEPRTSRGANDTDDHEEDNADDESSARRAPSDPGSAEYAGGRSPLADLPSLPADVSDAFEAFKLCILRHKLGDWADVSRDDLLRALDALKELALATGA